jgi:hypothetical protein
MKALLFVFQLLSLAIATPGYEAGGHHRNGNYHDRCLSDYESQEIIAEYISLFTASFSSKVAEALLTPDYKYVSQSTNFLIAKDVSHCEDLSACRLSTDLSKDPNFVTYASRADFIEAQSAAIGTVPAGQKFTVLNTFHSCDKIFFRWSLNAGQFPVVGMDYMELVHYGKHGWKITESFDEFNVGALLIDNGFSVCNNTAGS